MNGPSPTNRPGAPGSRVSGAVSVLSACAVLVGCGVAARSPVPPPAAIQPTAKSGPPAPCAEQAPTSLPAEQWSAARQDLAPPGASEVRLCRYSGLNARPRLTLVRSRLLKSPAVVRTLVGEFDQLPPPPPGAVACPNDDGSQIVALLAYPDGHSLTITTGLSGCESVTNGSVQRTASGVGASPALGPQLVARLERLLAGNSVDASGSAGELARARWSVLARSPLGTRYGATVVWDGRELLEIGGTRSNPVLDSGAAYTPATSRWQPLTSAPVQVAPDDAASVWTGQDLFVFGGPTSRASAGNCCVAGLYDPAANRWTVSAKAPFGRLQQPTAVWSGKSVILAGLTQGSRQQLEAASYDPSTDTWKQINPPISTSHPPQTLAMLATSEGILLWSLWGRSQQTGPGSFTIYSGVDVYRLGSSGTWADVTGRWPQHESVSSPLFTGTKILLPPGQTWCGQCSHPAPFDSHGYLVNPKTLHLTPISHGPLDDLGPQIIWTGAAEISLNQGGEIIGPRLNVRPGDIAIWNPRTNKWTRGSRAPKPLSDAPAVWTGTELLTLANNGTLLAFGP